jgi:hypothetical protein
MKMPLKSSYKSAPQLDRVNTVNHAFQKINGAIIADIDNNGYIDIITFPSNFTIDKYVAPVVWSNVNGVFSSTPSLIANQQSFQYVRDSIAGDFNNDGFMDYLLVDQGWELFDQDPRYFYGNNPHLLTGNSKGLTWEAPADWLTARDGGKTFNHIGDTADYDGDGDLDVAIADFHGYRLYQNDGKANFTWQENAIPATSGDASGTTFIKLGEKYAIVNGYFRIWDTSMTAKPLMVMEQKDGKFFESYTLARPDLGGREKNFGLSDMYNVDLNGDGREDLIVTWETVNSQGIDDGLSNLSGSPHTQRYKDLGNTTATVWFQDSNGKLYEDPAKNTYSFGWTAGAQIYFLDFNKDGHIDFFNTTYGVHPTEFNKLIWINDGKGNFSNTWTEFTVTEEFPDWTKFSPYFFDANGDGSIDVVAQNMVVDDIDYFKRNVGEELIVFLNPNTDSTSATNVKFGQIVRLYDAAFDRAPDADGLQNWIDHMDSGMKLETVAGHFISSPEFQSLYGTNISNEQFITELYDNVLDRTPDAAGLAWWTGTINQGMSRPNVLLGFSESAEYIGMMRNEIELVAAQLNTDPDGGG